VDRNGQLAIVAFISKELSSSHKLGRKAFQKLIHLATNLVGIPTGYQFSFYTYGAYSRELASDLELAEDICAVVSNRVSGTSGFDIQPGPMNAIVLGFADEVLDVQRLKLNWLIQNFGNLSARSLELHSTIVFVQQNESSHDDSAFFKRVQSLKPHYSLIEIESATNKIRELSSTLHTLN
jgi:uncharacterized protein YwgA